MHKTTKDLLLILISTLSLTFLVWLPHILALSSFWGLNFRGGFLTIYQNFDGLEYVIIAKSLYNPDILTTLPQAMNPIYYASHFPGYSLFISLFAPFLGFIKSMLLVSVCSTILAAWAFYLLVRDFKLSSHPLFLSLIFLILPARWLIVHSVGSSEPTFIFFVIMSVYFFMKYISNNNFSHILLSGFFGGLAQLTRPPGILLFGAMGLYILWQAYRRRSISQIFSYFPLLLIPLTLFGVFYLYSIQYGDLLAYFHSGDNIHLTFPPFQVFNKEQFWVGDIWLEDIVYTFILGFLAGILLWKQKLYVLSFVVLTYLGASSLIAHRDISRYILPITPFVLIAYERILTSREFKIILPIIALAIYLYSQNYILANTTPINPLDFAR